MLGKDDMLADELTKPLPAPRMTQLLHEFGVQ